MKLRRFSLRNIARKLFGPKHAPAEDFSAPVGQVARMDGGGRKPVRKERQEIEPLEGRIAPAALVDASTITYTDVDGDLVTIKFSKPLFTATGADPVAANNLHQIFRFSDGASTVIFESTGPQQLQGIDFSKILTFAGKNPASGISFSVIAEQAGEGDGLANVGAIRGAIPLGDVVIDGDLGKLVAGNGQSKVGIRSLTVESIGKFGTSTQSPGANPPTASDPAPDLEIRVVGQMGKLVVHGDVEGYVHVVNATTIIGTSIVVVGAGSIGSIEIGGSLIGKTGEDVDNTGLIDAQRDIGSVKIGTGAGGGGIIGGSGSKGGAIYAGGTIRSIEIADDVVGGAGKNSGFISATNAINKLSIGNDLVGGDGELSGAVNTRVLKFVEVGHDVVGGKGKTSGTINGSTNLVKATIGHDIVGGEGESSGAVVGGKVGTVVLVHDLKGGKGSTSGVISSGSTLTNVTIGRDIVGGEGADSGRVFAGADIKKVSVDNDLLAGKGDGSGVIIAARNIIKATVLGDLLGDFVEDSGQRTAGIFAGIDIRNVTVSGGVTGGDGALSGAISADAHLGKVTVTGTVLGGDGIGSGAITAGATIRSATIGGKLIGGEGERSGSLASGLNPVAPGNLVSAVINGGIVGGDGNSAGSVRAGGQLVKVVVGSGATVFGTALAGGAGTFSGVLHGAAGIKLVKVIGSVEGGAGEQSGAILGRGTLANVEITGDLKGGEGAESGAVAASERFDPVGSTLAKLGRVTIGGDLVGGVGERSGTVRSDGALQTLSVRNILGGEGDASGGVITGLGFASPGDVSNVKVLASIVAGAGERSGSLDIRGTLKSLQVTGSVTGATIAALDAINSLKIGLDLANATVIARGDATPTKTLDLAIGKVDIRGSVSGSQILAGYSADGVAINADASVGSVSVKGNWTASDLVAGVKDEAGDGFGNGDDVKAPGYDDPMRVAQIAKVVIGGNVAGSDAAGDHFGFVAQRILALKSAAGSVALDKAANTQVFDLGSTQDVTVREVPVA